MVLSREEILKLPSHQRKSAYRKRRNWRKEEAKRRLKEKIKQDNINKQANN